MNSYDNRTDRMSWGKSMQIQPKMGLSFALRQHKCICHWPPHTNDRINRMLAVAADELSIQLYGPVAPTVLTAPKFGSMLNCLIHYK